MVLGILSAYAALIVSIIALSIRGGESDHLTKLIKPLIPFPTAIVLWMVVQTLPLPFAAIAHPIWANTESALGGSLYGSLTIDTGATLLATIRFSVFAGLTFIASATSIDRVRAEALLVSLVLLSQFFAIALLAVGFSANHASFVLPSNILATLVDLSALGILINAANLIRTIERYETRKISQNITASHFVTRLTLSSFTFLVCCVATGLFATAQTTFVAVTAFLYFLMVLLIRRVGFKLWESAGLLVVVTITLGLVASVNSGTGDLTLRFAEIQAPAKTILTNMISNTPWAGNGAGTFLAILPIYQDAEHHLSGSSAPTTAASVLIEFGRTATWSLILMGLFVIGVLFKAALQRGRDSFYAAAASSCMIILLLQSFCDASLLTTPVMIMAAAIFGLGVAQRTSRTDPSRLSVT